MIPERDRKIGEILGVITNDCLPEIEPNDYGPSLYFYQRVMNARHDSNSVGEFLENEANIELLYATLTSWDMNSRGAKMLYFKDIDENFMENFAALSSHFQLLEEYQGDEQYENQFETFQEFLEMIRETYNYSHVMKTNSKIVSNSKIFHFLLPDSFMPIDGKYTLNYLYGNNSESTNKFMEIFNFVYEIVEILIDLNAGDYLDEMFYRSYPKLIDEAIIQIDTNDAH